MSKLNPANLGSRSRRLWISSLMKFPDEEGKSREDTRYPLESWYVSWGSVIFVLLSKGHWSPPVYSRVRNEVDAQKGYASR